MTLYQVAVHHAKTPFMPRQPDNPLTLVFTFACDLPDGTSAEQVAGWTFRTFNIDLDALERDHTTPGAGAAFPLACLYRQRRLRSLSVGDVLSVTVEGRTTWLACEPFGWLRIGTPHVAQDVC